MNLKIKSFFIILFLFLLGGNVLAQKANSADKDLREKLVGVWHASPYVAAGMNDNFQFFEDGTFKFNYNQMILSKRSISYSGRWEISQGKLILTVTEKTDIVGGKKIKSELSADGFEIEGGEQVAAKVKPAAKQTKTLSKITQDEIYKMMQIGGVKYWKLSDDPKSYEN